MDRVAGQYAIYGLDDVIFNTEGRMQMRYNICNYFYWTQVLCIASVFSLFCNKLVQVRLPGYLFLIGAYAT